MGDFFFRMAGLLNPKRSELRLFYYTDFLLGTSAVGFFIRQQFFFICTICLERS